MTEASKGTYSINAGISERLVLACLAIFLPLSFFSFAGRDKLGVLIALFTPILIWIIDRFVWRKKIRCIVRQKEIAYSGKSSVAYRIKPEGWNSYLQVDDFIYSLLDERAEVIVDYGVISHLVSKITIL